MEIKNVTMADIAKKLGLSKYAVSLALSSKKGVSETTRELVFKTAEEMGYKINYHASVLKSNKTNTIGIVTSEYALQEPLFFTTLLAAIEKDIRSRGFNLNIVSIDEDAKGNVKVPDLITKTMVDGIIVISNIGTELIKKIAKYNIPMVLVDHYDDTLHIDSIMTDNFYGAYKAVKYLDENGIHRMGFIGDTKIAASYMERWNGFKKAVEDCKLKLEMKFCKTCGYENFAENNEPEIAAFIGELDEMPEAFFCVSDLSAAVLNNVLLKKGISVPDDVSIIGFDDTKLAQLNTPALTMVHIHKEFYGERAVEQLFYNIKHPGKPVETVRIETNLIERNSVKQNSEVI